jgi:uncharacterized repeat protein (TIGR01451 family)
MKLRANRHLSLRAVIITLTSVFALAVVFTLVWNGKQTSAQMLSCGITQITFTTSLLGANTVPSISADGTRIAFVSHSDLTGGNADSNHEIFLYDTVTNSFTQVTHTTGGSGNSGPSLSSDGTRIAFSSDRNLTGGNAELNTEIYFYDTGTNSFTQVTNTPVFPSDGPSISGNGTRVAFESSTDLTGGNADHNNEIFLYNLTTNSFTQVTNTMGTSAPFPASFEPSLSADGTRIAFFSSGDLTGGNADANFEVFLYDTITNLITQVTNTTSASGPQSAINADGTRIALATNQNLTGGNADANFEIFIYNTAMNTFTQVTSTTEGSIEHPSINADGTRIAFESDHDHTGGNADSNDEIFLYDTTTNSFTQVTDTTEFSSHPSLNADGSRIAFASNGFANLGNPDGNTEIFLAACLPPPPPSADLFIDQTADEIKVKQGELLTYTLTVGNLGPDQATNVMVFDELSTGVAFVSAQANKGSFTTPPVDQTGIVVWNLGSMASGDQEAAQIQVTVIVRGRDTITNTARVISSIADPDGTNNSSSLTTIVQPGKKK